MGSCRLSVQFGRVLGGAMGSSHKFNATAVTIPPTPSWTMDGWRESGVCMGGAQDAMRTAVRLQVDDASGSRVVEGAHHCEEDAATASRKRMGKPGKHRDGGLGVVPIGWGGETARQRVRLIGLIPSFFFGVFLSPAPLQQCPVCLQPLLVWMGGLLLHLLDLGGRALSCCGLCFFSEDIKSSMMALAMRASFCRPCGHRWLTPRHHVFPQACTCVPSWDVNGR